ncbi:hypothetical protein ACOMHN_049484 [Nucella lapillus]
MHRQFHVVKDEEADITRADHCPVERCTIGQITTTVDATEITTTVDATEITTTVDALTTIDATEITTVDATEITTVDVPTTIDDITIDVTTTDSSENLKADEITVALTSRKRVLLSTITTTVDATEITTTVDATEITTTVDALTTIDATEITTVDATEITTVDVPTTIDDITIDVTTTDSSENPKADEITVALTSRKRVLLSTITTTVDATEITTTVDATEITTTVDALTTIDATEITTVDATEITTVDVPTTIDDITIDVTTTDSSENLKADEITVALTSRKRVLLSTSIARSVPPLFGWVAYTPEGFQTSCTFDYLTRNDYFRSYILCLYIFGFAVPLAIILFCYYFIFRAVARHEKDMAKMAKKLVAT